MQRQCRKVAKHGKHQQSRQVKRHQAPQGVRFDRSFLAIAAAEDGLGVALESTRLAERELKSGRLVRPLAGKEKEMRYNAHYPAYSGAARQRYTIGVFQKWLLAELATETGGQP